MSGSDIKNNQVSVIVVTKNEGRRLQKCLEALRNFQYVYVVDSNSWDQTREIANQFGTNVVSFSWDGQYPKKYQWCLDKLHLQTDWVLFVDADEIVTQNLFSELLKLDFRLAGYFIKARYRLNGKLLKYGLQNNKLCLINRHKIQFPVVDDLDLDGMGEIEGNYQPILRKGHEKESIGQLCHYMIHDSMDDLKSWEKRHYRYAQWEVGMDNKKAWPTENRSRHRFLKACFKKLPFRGIIAFVHSYILKRGFLDGKAGFKMALSRYQYYRMINKLRSNI